MAITAVWVGAVVVTALWPALAVFAVVVDLVRRVRFATVRALAIVTLYLWAEAIGVLVAGLIGRDQERNYALQRRWAAVLGHGAFRIFGIHLDVSGGETLATGPFLLLVRHAAVADVLLPMLLVANPHRLHPRYVLKRELRWDPCLDVVGSRIPNAFVNRDGTDTEAQLALVRSMAGGLGAHDFVALYPEGTRFTPARRARALDRLAPADRAWAETLTRTLPPRPGGVLALLEAAPESDVVILAHTGMDAATTLKDLMNGGIVHARWRVRAQRHPRATIPSEPAAQIAWLNARWSEMDAWISQPEPP